MSGPDDLKSSAQVWGGDASSSSGITIVRATPQTTSAAEGPPDLPPAYTTSEIRSPPPTSSRPSGPPPDPLRQTSLLSSIDFSKYSIPEATVSDDRSTTTITLPHFYTKPDVLAHLIQEQAALPPKLIMHMKGTHSDSVNRTILDFDLWFNLTTLLDLPKDDDEDSEPPTPSRLRIKDVRLGEGAGSVPAAASDRRSSKFLQGMTKRSNNNSTSSSPLQIWAKRFCDDKSEHKSFTLTRLLPSTSYRTLTALLEGQIRTLLAQLNYRGKLTISFPAEYSTVVVLKEPPGAWGFFTSILKIYPLKKYEVVNSVWAFRGAANGGTGSGHKHEAEIGETNSAPTSITGRGEALSSVGSGAGSRPGFNDSVAARTAQEWWDEWKEVVRNVVLKKQRGRVSVEDWIESKMGSREKDKTRDWGVDGGD